jgi:hypothetical protein
MTPHLAYEFLYQTLLGDTDSGELNDGTANTSPAGVASFVTNRLYSAFRDPTRAPTDYPYCTVSIDDITDDESQAGGEPIVTATFTIVDSQTAASSRIVKIGNALYGNYPSVSGGRSTFGIVRRALVAVVDTTINAQEWVANATYGAKVGPLVPYDGDPEKVSISYTIKFMLASKITT